MIRKHSAHHREPEQLQPPVPDLVQPGDRQHITGHRRDHEDGQLEGDLGHGGGVRRDQGQDLRGGDRVAVVGVVEQEPGAGRPGQHDQPPAVGQEGPQPHLMLQPAGPVPGCPLAPFPLSPVPAGPVPADLPAGEGRHPARRLLRLPLHLDLVARRFGHPAAQVDHRRGGHRAQGEQDPPRRVVTGARAEQRQRDQRPDDQPERLGAEHHPDQLAAVLAVGVLADHHGADRVVTADAEAEHEPEARSAPSTTAPAPTPARQRS